jgi:hypothetical protein
MFLLAINNDNNNNKLMGSLHGFLDIPVGSDQYLSVMVIIMKKICSFLSG